jgi:hypothetical protein
LDLNQTIHPDISESINWYDPIEEPSAKKDSINGNAEGEEEEANLVELVWNANPIPTFNAKRAFKRALTVVGAIGKMEKDMGEHGGAGSGWAGILGAGLRKGGSSGKQNGNGAESSSHVSPRSSIVSDFSSGEEDFEDADGHVENGAGMEGVQKKMEGMKV